MRRSAAALERIQRASRANAERRELVRSIGAIGAAAADQAYLGVKQADAGADEDIAALAASAERLLATIARGAAVESHNRVQRAAARTRLDVLRQRLVEGVRGQARNPGGRPS